MKLQNYNFNITSPIAFEGNFDMQSLNLFCGMNGSGKTLVNKINYFGSYIQASIPEMLKVQVYEMLTHVDDGTLDLITETSFVESFQAQFDSLDKAFINNIFNGVVLPDLFEENNLTGTLSYILENEKSYNGPLDQVNAQLAGLELPEIPEGMTLTPEDEIKRANDQRTIDQLVATKAQLEGMFSTLDLIETLTINIVIENNIFKEITFDAVIKEFQEGEDHMHFMEQKLASIMLMGDMAYPTYMTGSSRNFGNFEQFMKTVPQAKKDTQETCQIKTDNFQAMMNYWKQKKDEHAGIAKDEDQQAAAHIQERMNVVEYFFGQSIDFWHKKEFLELCVKNGFSIMDTEVFLKIEKFKESIKEHGFKNTNPMAADMLSKMDEMFKVDDIMVVEDTLCVMQDGKRKTCLSLSAGEQSILIMFMVPFYKL